MSEMYGHVVILFRCLRPHSTKIGKAMIWQVVILTVLFFWTILRLLVVYELYILLNASPVTNHLQNQARISLILFPLWSKELSRSENGAQCLHKVWFPIDHPTVT